MEAIKFSGDISLTEKFFFIKHGAKIESVNKDDLYPMYTIYLRDGFWFPEEEEDYMHSFSFGMAQKDVTTIEPHEWDD